MQGAQRQLVRMSPVIDRLSPPSAQRSGKRLTPVSWTRDADGACQRSVRPASSVAGSKAVTVSTAGPPGADESVDHRRHPTYSLKESEPTWYVSVAPIGLEAHGAAVKGQTVGLRPSASHAQDLWIRLGERAKGVPSRVID